MCITKRSQLTWLPVEMTSAGDMTIVQNEPISVIDSSSYDTRTMCCRCIWCSREIRQTSMMTIFGLPTSDRQCFSGARSTSTLISSPSAPYTWPLCAPWLRTPTAIQSCNVWSSSATGTANQLPCITRTLPSNSADDSSESPLYTDCSPNGKICQITL